MKVILVLLLVAYILSPVDLIPDVLPVVGTADDGLAGVIIGAILKAAISEKGHSRQAPSMRRVQR